MKTRVKNLFLLPALIAGLGLIPAGRVAAQTFKTLHSFSTISHFTNSDGAYPSAGLVLSGNTLYGTARHGGGGGSSDGEGTVFKLSTDGTSFTTLHIFNSVLSEGRYPYGGVVLSGDTLYGTTYQGGNSDFGTGTIFAVNTNGTGFTNVYSFGNAAHPNDGTLPEAGLILAGNTLYGTTTGGGDGGFGTVFAVNTNGASYGNLHHFLFDGSDGRNSLASLILSNSTLYGTASSGGTGWGTLFKVNINGLGYTNLYSFTAETGPNTNRDGANPVAELILSGNTLYGTAQNGGSMANGTVFAVNTDGTGFTNLHNFTGGSDGGNPLGGLVLSGNTLYGTASAGGSSGYGTVFAVKTDGTGFTNLYSFTPWSASNPATNSDGAVPLAGLVLSGNTLYGTASGGGVFGHGTVFSLSLPPPVLLTIVRSGTNAILTWPTNTAGFTLQSITNLVSPAFWSNVSPAAVVINGQNTVTNPIFGAWKFYRLIK